MATFIEIRDRVKAYLIDVPVETEPLVREWVNKAMRDAQSRHNFASYADTLSLETAEGQRTLAAKPTNWKEHRALPWLEHEDGGSDEIGWAASKSEMIRLHPEDEDSDEGGEPEFVLELPDEFHVFPIPDERSLWPDGNYRVRLPYWRLEPAMESENDSNFFTTDLEWYLTFSAVAEGLIFNREEERSAVYVEKAEHEFQRAVRKDKRSKLGDRFTLGITGGVFGTPSASRW